MKEMGIILTKITDWMDKNRVNQYKNKLNGTNFKLGNKVYMVHPEHIFIGEGSYINGGYIIASPNASIYIGKNCLISYDVHIRTETHNYIDKDKLIKNQGNQEKDIVIEDDVWIGYGVQIMPGVTLQEGSVIGAGAIVTHSTEPYCVYAGVPARKIKERE